MASAAPKILVVDDHAHNRLIYGESLRQAGVEVLEAADGSRALQLAREHDFAMFLVDINMPEMDGFELASLLRQEPRAESTPIVFVTSDTTERSYLMRGYRMGAVDFMVSAPVQGEILARKAWVFVQMFRKRRELQELADGANRENAVLRARLQEFIAERDSLRAQATHDTLTKLPNRALLQDRLCAALARAARSRQRFALAYLDLDGFKAVNDRHGHATGDALIVAVAGRLSGSLRGTDTVARLGGDEFALLFEGLDSGAAAEHVAHKIHRVLAEPLRLRSETAGAEVEVRVGASVGVAVYPDHATAVEDLVTLADLTMYAAKRDGGGVRVHAGPGVTRRVDADEPGDGPRLQLVRSHPAAGA